MSCKEYIYSNEYLDLLIDYNYNINQVYTRFNPDCVNILSDKYAVIYKQIDNLNQLPISTFGYNSFPKLYTLQDEQAFNSIGLDRLRRIERLNLTGTDVIIGFVDTGINYTLDIFKRENNISRIVALWDQNEGESEENSFFNYGTYYDNDIINRAINSDNPYDYVSQVDEVGHGTSVAALACGGISSNEQHIGVAYNADIAMVKLKPAKKNVKEYYGVKDDIICYQENDILAGIIFLEEIAKRLNKPLVICICVGSNQGGHEGKSYTGDLVNFLSDIPGIACVIAGGNEVNERHHYRGNISISGSNDIDNVEMNVGENVEGFFLEIWTQTPNQVGVGFTSPTGEIIPMINYNNDNNEEVLFLFDNTRVYVNYINSVVGSGNALVFIRFKNPLKGLWRLQIFKNARIDGRYDIWLPIKGLIRERIELIDSDPSTTLVSIANASNSITVSGYNMENNGLYVNSSRGYTFDERIKPDIAAPSVGVDTINSRGDSVKVNGTSYGAAICAGCVGLLYEWADSVI